MATVTRTFELSIEAAAALDRRAKPGEPRAIRTRQGAATAEALDPADFTPEQWNHIQEGLAEEKAGRFASKAEIAAIFELSREQLEELDLALAEVDAGEIATDKEAEAFFKKFAA